MFGILFMFPSAAANRPSTAFFTGEYAVAQHSSVYKQTMTVDTRK